MWWCRSRKSAARVEAEAAAVGVDHASIVPRLRRRRSDEDDAAVPERSSAAALGQGLRRWRGSDESVFLSVAFD
ncbi:hypothetical protein OsI_28480 [Oryza sativa Indica Group]|uniref:Uncharacterized protein n=1 Tax=Oryza sativa subsp. indica TaxID=39946 RepID=A2YT30_ORYSI|nr:hypothetical protein OsI_28480 [Oryza sativa Indica Group]